MLYSAKLISRPTHSNASEEQGGGLQNTLDRAIACYDELVRFREGCLVKANQSHRSDTTQLPSLDELNRIDKTLSIRQLSRDQFIVYKRIRYALLKYEAHLAGTYDQVRQKQQDSAKRYANALHQEKLLLHTMTDKERAQVRVRAHSIVYFKQFSKYMRNKVAVAHRNDDGMSIDESTLHIDKQNKTCRHYCSQGSACPAHCNFSARELRIEPSTMCSICGAAFAQSWDADPGVGHIAGKMRLVCNRCQSTKQWQTLPQLFLSLHGHFGALEGTGNRWVQAGQTVAVGKEAKQLRLRQYKYRMYAQQEKRKFGLNKDGLTMVLPQDAQLPSGETVAAGTTVPLLTPQEMFKMMETQCFWCGQLPSEEYAHGIDRWLAYLGMPYLRGFCVPSCGMCNTMRCDLSTGKDIPYGEYRPYLQSIVSHLTSVGVQPKRGFRWPGSKQMVFEAEEQDSVPTFDALDYSSEVDLDSDNDDDVDDDTMESNIIMECIAADGSMVNDELE